MRIPLWFRLRLFQFLRFRQQLWAICQSFSTNSGRICQRNCCYFSTAFYRSLFIKTIPRGQEEYLSRKGKPELS